MAFSNQTSSVYDDLKQKIIKGIYKPSENLREVELATYYGVSRNTVKKALLMLEKDNYIVLEKNKGAKVKAYSKQEVLEFLEIRGVLEGFILKLTVPVITDSEINHLEEIVNEMKKRKDNRNLLEYSVKNQEFHQTIYSACPNKTLVDITVNLKNQMRKYNTKTILVPGRDEQSYSEHSAILDAIKNRNAELAEQLMQIHIENVRQTFKDNFDLLFY